MLTSTSSVLHFQKPDYKTSVICFCFDNNIFKMKSQNQTQQSKPSNNTNSLPISIETIDSSLQKLTKTWHTRQQWHLFFTHSKHNPPNGSRQPWRNSLAKFLESTPSHVVVVLLLLVDLILTILDLSPSYLSCKPHKIGITEKGWYHWTGIAILSILSAKSVALVMALGSSFFRRPGHVVDGVVVIGALFLEAFFERKGGGLLLLVSLWRFVRVIESAYELSDKAIEAQIEVILREFEALKEENRTLLQANAEKDIVIEKLQETIERLQEQIHNQ